MNWREFIIADPAVLIGKPTLRSTRISLEHVVNLLAQGWTEQQILDNYPRLTQQSLQAVFAYLYDCMQDGLFAGTVKESA